MDGREGVPNERTRCLSRLPVMVDGLQIERLLGVVQTFWKKGSNPTPCYAGSKPAIGGSNDP